jgi:hypothetical protein
VALSLLIACIVMPSARAQDGANVPVIRLDARQVLIPTRVWAAVDNIDYEAVRLDARDFLLFEDEREQTVGNAALIRSGMLTISDNHGKQHSIALTPRGKWTNLDYEAKASYFPSMIYEIAYRPPESPEGSCHNIKIKVKPRSESGNRMTTAEAGPIPRGNHFLNPTLVIDRRSLLLYYRTQYCNLPHFATDPLSGTPVSERLESVANSDRAKDEGFSLGAVVLYDESNTSRVHIALDFPHLSTRTGIPGFQAALLGMFSRANGGVVARFSDSVDNGCPFIDEYKVDDVTRLLCGREFFYNHYETEAVLPPGDYNLRVAIDFGGALRRAEVPLHVRAPEKALAVSGIALCMRYFPHDQPLRGSQPPPDGIPTLPFELTPLVSNGIEFTPTGQTHFKKKDPLAAYFEIYEPLLASGENIHVQFEVRIIDAKTDEVKSDTGFESADGYVNQGKAVIPISQKIAIGELSAGAYQVQIRAKDSSGNSTAWRTTSFTRE